MDKFPQDTDALPRIVAAEMYSAEDGLVLAVMANNRAWLNKPFVTGCRLLGPGNPALYRSAL